MSYLTANSGKIILQDAFNKPRTLVDLITFSANQSDLMQNEFVGEVNGTLQRLFDQTSAGAINAITFLRIVNELARKPQHHNALHIGQWSPLDDTLAVTLPKFNAQNSLWCYVPARPVGKFANVNFIFAEVQRGGVMSYPKTNSTR